MRLLYAVKVRAGFVEIFTDTQKPTTLLKYGNETLSDIHIICKVICRITIPIKRKRTKRRRRRKRKRKKKKRKKKT